jgi:hypothetical protein
MATTTLTQSRMSCLGQRRQVPGRAPVSISLALQGPLDQLVQLALLELKGLVVRQAQLESSASPAQLVLQVELGAQAQLVLLDP